MNKLLAFLFVLAIMPVTAQATLFDCISESCLYNGTKGLWDCQYLDCPAQPDWIQNITQINTTQVNITNCSYDNFYEYWDNYLERLDKRFNFSVETAETKASLDSCQKELDFCIESKSGLVDKAAVDRCNAELQDNVEKLESEQAVGWWKAFGGIIAGAAIVWFLGRKSSFNKTDIEPASGEQRFNPKAIDSDIVSAKMQARIEELEHKLGSPRPEKTPDRRQRSNT